MSNVIRILEQPCTARLIKFTPNSACVSIPSSNAFSTEGDFCYVNKDPLEGMEVGAVFELPAGKLVTRLDEDGNVKATKNGVPLAFYEGV